MRTHRHRVFAAGLLVALAALQASAPARAGTTDISDVPMLVNNAVNANIMFMLDNSGSMQNVVVDVPYDAKVTYPTASTGTSTSCTGANLIAAGTSVDISISGGEPRINYSGNSSKVFGNSGSDRCFGATATYDARLHADSGTGPSGYLPTEYSGNFLNWYFNKNNTTPAWTASQKLKPGTQSRMEVTRGAAKSMLSNMSNVRVGLSTYNTAGVSCSTFDISCFQGARILVGMDAISSNLTSMNSQVDALSATGVTPLSETLAGLGRYFVEGFAGATLTLHPDTTKETVTASSVLTQAPAYASGVSAPTTSKPVITGWCQSNFIVLMTDGRPQADQALSSNTHLRNYSGECATSACASAGSNPVVAGSGFGTQVGRTYESNGSDYLDEVANFLFDVDLRPDLNDNNGKPVKNNIRTYAIGFADSTVADDPLLKNTAAKGGGQFFTANNSSELVSAFNAIIDNIKAVDGAAAAVAVSNPEVKGGDNFTYATSYDSGNWDGDLNSFEINLTTGIVSTTPFWTSSAKAQLDQLAKDNGNNASGKRKIVTHDGTVGAASAPGVAFQWTGLSSAQKATLHTPFDYKKKDATTVTKNTDGADVLAFLRGDRTKENSQFRLRSSLMGDTVNAEPLLVRAPFNSYADTGYSTYKTDKAGRARTIYQGANDGMLHAFDAATGAERWAYVPDLLFEMRDAAYSTASQLNNLSRLSGFQHKYYVDGTPVAGDVDFKNTLSGKGSGTDWRTLLVGGLGKGGRGYYALNISDSLPADTTEATAASKVLWEFPKSIRTSADYTKHKPNVGFSFGKPVIVKTESSGWVVLVSSGYNNGTTSGGDGRGYLFVLDAANGDLIKAIQTPDSCTAADPCGLGQISAYVENSDVDNTVDFAYGGDLKGNVWRFDLTGPASGWAAVKLATLLDGKGAFQPVTTAPELAKVTVKGGDKRFIYVGTGLYLGMSDVPGISGENAHATQTQTMYALIDDLSKTPTITGLRHSAGTLCPAGGGDGALGCQGVASSTTTERTYTSNSFDFTSPKGKKGWYIDLPLTGERVYSDPVLAFGVVAFTSAIPSGVACNPGGSSWINFLDYKSGGYVISSTIKYSAKYLGNTLSARPVLVKLPSGDIKAIIRKSDGTNATEDVPAPKSSGSGRAVSWRELIQQ